MRQSSLSVYQYGFERGATLLMILSGYSYGTISIWPYLSQMPLFTLEGYLKNLLVFYPIYLYFTTAITTVGIKKATKIPFNSN